MPNNIVKSIATKTGKSPEAVEGKWHQAEDLTHKQYPHVEKGSEEYYRIVNSLTHKLSGVKETVEIPFANAFMVSKDTGKAYYDSAAKFEQDASAIGAITETTGNVVIAKKAGTEIGRYNTQKQGTLAEGYGTIAVGAAPSTSGDIHTTADGDDISTTIQAGTVFDGPGAPLPPDDQDMDDDAVTTPITFAAQADDELADIADIQESHKPFLAKDYIRLISEASGKDSAEVSDTWSKVRKAFLAEGREESADALNERISEVVLEAVSEADEAPKGLYRVIAKHKKTGEVIHVVSGEPVGYRTAEKVARGMSINMDPKFRAEIVPHDSPEAQPLKEAEEHKETEIPMGFAKGTINNSATVRHEKLPGKTHDILAAHSGNKGAVTVAMAKSDSRTAGESFYLSPDEAHEFGKHLVKLAKIQKGNK